MSTEKDPSPVAPFGWAHFNHGQFVRFIEGQGAGPQELARLNREYPADKPHRKMIPLYAARPLVEPVGWRPIETAPKNGTAFLAFFPFRTGYHARQDVVPTFWTDVGFQNATSGHFFGESPTHWMPLPSAPSED